MTPIIMTDPRQLTPSFYKLFYFRHICKTCGHIHSHSEVTAMVAVGSGFSGAIVKSLAELEYNLPVKVETVAERTTPFCHLCWRPGMLNHLPQPAPPPTKPQPSWAGQGLSEPKKPATTKEPKAKKTYTVDDLDID